MKSDQAHIQTDVILSSLEKEIAKAYLQAQKEVQEKLDDYYRRFLIKDKKWRKWVEEGKKTEAEYKQWRLGQLSIDRRWASMRDALAADYHNANLIARSTTSGYMPEVYALNHNYGTYEIEHGSRIDTSYTLYDRQTVERLWRENPDLMPDPSPNGKTARRLAANKDLRWNRKKIQSAVVQGILQGEGIPKIAKRLESVTDMNHRAAIRNARTMITSAENAGRIDSYTRANNMGIKTRKTWIATLDNRTRHAHRDLDGQTQDVDLPFESELGEIMYPGDPAADPANVWNCRCALISQIEGFEIDLSDRYNADIGGMTYDEWLEGHNQSEHITKQEEISEAARQKYINEYRRG